MGLAAAPSGNRRYFAGRVHRDVHVCNPEAGAAIGSLSKEAPRQRHQSERRPEADTPPTLILLSLLVPVYGAMLLVAADRAPHRLLWSAAVGVSLTQTAVLALAPTGMGPSAPLALLLACALLPPVVGTLTLRVHAVRHAAVEIRCGAAATAWLLSLSPVYIFS